MYDFFFFFFFSSRRRHTRWNCDWSSDVCSSDVALGIYVGHVSVGEVSRIVSGTRSQAAGAEGTKDDPGCLVEQPSIVVVEIDIDYDALVRRALGREVVDVGPEVHVTGSVGRENYRGGVGRRRVLKRIDPGGAGVQPDVDDPLRLTNWLRTGGGVRCRAAAPIEDLNAAVGSIADIDVAVIAKDDAVRVTAAGGSKRARRAVLTACRRAVDHALRAPLAGIGSIGVEDDHPMVAVAISDVDAPSFPGNRID